MALSFFEVHESPLTNVALPPAFCKARQSPVWTICWECPGGIPQVGSQGYLQIVPYSKSFFCSTHLTAGLLLTPGHSLSLAVANQHGFILVYEYNIRVTIMSQAWYTTSYPSYSES